MSDCEWMFADAATGILGINALAHLNPLRWSGPLSFDKAIADLEDVLRNSSRPILVKVPANTLDFMECSSTEEAIEYLKSMDPKRVAQAEAARTAAEAAQRLAEAEAAEAAATAAAAAERVAALKAAAEAARSLLTTREEAAKMVAAELAEARRSVEAAEGTASTAHAEREAALEAAAAAEAAVSSAKSDRTCEWMFGDIGIGSVGLAIAQMNPFRWSDIIKLDECSLQLAELSADDAARPIVLKMAQDVEQTFPMAARAIEHLREVCPVKQAAKRAAEEAQRRAEEAKAKELDEGEKLVAARENEEKAVARGGTASAEVAEAAKQAEEAEAAYAKATSA